MRLLNKLSKAVTLLLISATPAYAVDVTWNGFGSIGATFVSNIDLVYNGGFRYGPYESGVDFSPNSKISLQSKADFSDRFAATVQLVARSQDGGSVEADWAYLTFQATEHLKLRAGLMRRSIFRFSDFLDVGYAYPWVRPPLINYFSLAPLYTSIPAVDIFYEKPIGEWSFTTQFYVGGSTGKDTLDTRDVVVSESEPFGATIELNGETMRFRLGYHKTHFSLSVPELDQAKQVLMGSGFNEAAEHIMLDKHDSGFYSLGAQYSYNAWTIDGEISLADASSFVQPNFNAWYLSIGRNIGRYTMYGGYGEQKIRYDSKKINAFIGDIESARESTPSTDVASRFILDSVQSELGGYISESETNRQTLFTGVRYDFDSNKAIKLEFEELREDSRNKPARIVNLSLDFVF